MQITANNIAEKEILQNKINNVLSKSEIHVKPVLDKIQKECQESRDFISPLGIDGKINFLSNGSLKMNQAGETFKLHEHAIGQAGERLGIPTGYIKKMAFGPQWQRDLAADILNEHSLYTDRKKVLVRAIGDEVRGILSDQYRRLDTFEIYSTFFQECQKYNAATISAHIDATRTYCETIYPEVIEVPTERNGLLHMVFGLRISNSDFGDGALQLQSYGMQVVCLNGMTRNNMLRQVHLGRRLPDDLSLSEETYRLDTMTQASLIGDMVKQNFSRENIENQIHEIQKASETKIDLVKEISNLKNKGLYKAEVEKVEEVLMSNRTSDGVQGEGTLWKLSQAMTAVARDHQNKRRQREIEDISGKLFDRLKIKQY
jgi:hypothetical protein